VQVANLQSDITQVIGKIFGVRFVSVVTSTRSLVPHVRGKVRSMSSICDLSGLSVMRGVEQAGGHG
jgi:hypothetical protein